MGQIQQVVEQTESEPSRVLILIGALDGLASVAESRGQFDEARAQYQKIIAKAKKLGYARNHSDALKLAHALRTMKAVFVNAGIKEPSANQLFNAIKGLTAGTGFVSMSAALKCSATTTTS